MTAVTQTYDFSSFCHSTFVAAKMKVCALFFLKQYPGNTLVALVLLLTLLGGKAGAQTDLVRWNGANNGFAANILTSNISASDITNHGGGSLSNNGQWNQHFQTGSWPSGALNASRYIQFTITPNAGYKIDPDQFNFEVQMDGGNANFEVRYSKDFSQGYSSFNGTISGSWATRSGSLTNAGPVTPGQTLYVRLYVFNTWNALRIRHSWGGTGGPTITGTVSPAVTGAAADLGVTKSMSNTTPQPGNNVTYTVAVTNHSANTASGASAIDQLPPGFTYVSSVASTGAYNSGTGIWTIGNLAPNATATLQIVAQMQASGPYTNTATVSHYGSDPTPGNNTASVTPTNVCSDCTHAISGGTITVNAGETYCLHSGSWSGGVKLNAGGTICIGTGATFNVSYLIDNSAVNGTIINRGTVSGFPFYNNTTHNATIENYGSFNTIAFQNFAGTLNNTGRFMMPSGNASFSAGAVINNHGKMHLRQLTSNNASINTHDSLAISDGLNVNNGVWTNALNAVVRVNMATQGSNVNFIGDIENSGHWQFARISSLSGTVNNYGKMEVYNTVNDISTATYLTNDSLLYFIGVQDVQFNGPMLTNNGRLEISHSSGGNLKLNQPINQLYNNGIIIASGQVQHNMAGSRIVNTCRIVCKDYFVGNGVTENFGLIWATDLFEIEGTASGLSNANSGHIRGARFRNSGNVSGYGTYYFTGSTNFQSAGTFAGSDAGNPIQFFDASQTGGQIFDSYVANNPPVNTIRPGSMTPSDTTSYACSTPPKVAGYPPTTSAVSRGICTSHAITFDLHDFATAHVPVASENFTLLWSSVRLFEFNNSSNPTNNSTSLHITGKGSFTVNTTTGVVTFVPDAAFTSGTVVAEYRISNKRPGDPVTYPSARTKITITFGGDIIPPSVTPSNY